MRFPKKLWIMLAVVSIMTGLGLHACAGNTATVRFKVIVDAMVDGKPVQGSNVHEVRYKKLSKSLLGYGGSTQEFGEAVVVDLGSRGTLFVLPRYMFESRDPRSIFPEGLLDTVGLIKTSTGTLSQDDLQFLRSLKTGERFPFHFYSNAYRMKVNPLMVTFRDTSKVESMVLVTKDNFGDIFGPNSELVGISLEITDEPITTGAAEVVLPFLKDRSLVWWTFTDEERALPLDQRPFVKFINRNSFYARGSR